MKLLHTLAPFLRGCTYNGEKGAVVLPLDPEKAVKLKGEPSVLSLPQDNFTGTDGEVDIEKAEETLAAALLKYQREYRRYPKTLLIENLGGYTLGESYEDAKNNTEVNPSGSAGFDRNRVVKNKIALVTGAAQGFGEGIVRELTAAGAVVFIADLNVEGAEKVADEVNRENKRQAAFPVKVNVAEEESVRGMFENVCSVAGGVDICISNAGVLKAGSVKELPLKDFRFVTDVNYIGYFLCTKYASQVMAAQARGARKCGAGAYYSDIIQINSKSGLEGSNRNGAYAGGKFGGIGLTQSFAKELITDHIKVNSICPGNFFDGPLWSDPEKGLFVQYLRAGKVPGAETVEEVKRFYESKVPMDRGCTVQDVIKAVYYTVEQRYETGQAIPVTGGQVMLK